ncbi:hypothetical protein S245_018951, partial [Arachis hypogaea]
TSNYTSAASSSSSPATTTSFRRSVEHRVLRFVSSLRLLNIFQFLQLVLTLTQ